MPCAVCQPLSDGSMSVLGSFAESFMGCYSGNKSDLI